MKIGIPLVAVGLATACGAALATEYGNVISSTAVTAQVAVPLQQCTDQPQLVQPRTTGAGAILGAVVGGVVGNSVGGGLGRAAATGIGVVAGAALGNQAEAASTPPAEATVRSCQTVTSFENRIVGYDVVYDYNGQRYSARVAQDPGAHIALAVSVAPTTGAMVVTPVAALSPVVASAPVIYAPAPVYGPDVYGAPAVAVLPSVTVGVGGYVRRGYWR